MNDFLPSPFAWVNIPSGKVRLVEESYFGEQTDKGVFNVPAFSIAKYPVTNAQFAQFVEADGYIAHEWWTDEGWEVREKGFVWEGEIRKPTDVAWTQPCYWQDSKWNQPNHAVTGVSWYEALAFCRWLSSRSGENISLPTEQQWQSAAQTLPSGKNSGYLYPWGNDWNGKYCNNDVEPEKSRWTTPVTKYEASNVSPCGVVDMAGNVSEWCLNDYETLKQNNYKNAGWRVLRGGHWGGNRVNNFRSYQRAGTSPSNRIYFQGFRIILSKEFD